MGSDTIHCHALGRGKEINEATTHFNVAFFTLFCKHRETTLTLVVMPSDNNEKEEKVDNKKE